MENKTAKPVAAKKTNGLFGGSFNPPHLGHRQVAQELLERGIVDEIWFLPCKNHAFGKTLAPDSKRLASLKKLILSLPKKTRIKSRVEPYEILQTQQLSISYLTLIHLQQENPDFIFKFIIGSDQVRDFPQWHFYRDLLHQFAVLVYPRNTDLNPPLLANMFYLTQLPTVDISSTQIRHLQEMGDPSWHKLVVN